MYWPHWTCGPCTAGSASTTACCAWRAVLDADLWQRAHDTTRAVGHPERTARGIAGPITVDAALPAWRWGPRQAVATGAGALPRLGSEEGDIEAVSRVLHRPRSLDPIRERVAPQETRAHA